MSGEKIQLARQTILEAIARLDARDRFSVVAYDDVVEVVVDATAATPESRARAAARLAAIDARASTNLSGGWLRGAEQVALRPARRRREPGSAPDGRARQQGDHGRVRARDPRRPAPGARRLDDDVRDRRRLRRGPAPGHGRRRWRPLLLRPRRGDDSRPHLERGRGDARGRRPRRRARGRRRRRCPGRGDLAAAAPGAGRPDDRRPRRSRLRAGPRCRAPADVSVRRCRGGRRAP